MIKVAIVEDNKKDAKKINEYIEKFSKDMDIEISVKKFDHGLDFISDYSMGYDLVLLDIDMPFMDGIETAKRLRKLDGSVPIIFITNLAQFAIKGYEVNALDFMAKPVNYITLKEKLQRAVDYISSYMDFSIIIKTKTEFRKLYVKDIKFVEVFGHSLIYHLVNEKIQIRGQLLEAEKLLGKYSFCRCSNCYLINLRYVSAFSSSTVTVGEDVIAISRRKKNEFYERLTNFYGV